MVTTTEKQDVKTAEAADVSPEDLLDQLLLFEPVPAPFISPCLDARTNETGQRTFLPFVRKQLTERGRSYAADSPERANFEEDFVRILLRLDSRRDERTAAIISRADSLVTIRVMKTNEELTIARHTRDLVGSSPSVKSRGGKHGRTR
jgi:hypothetical protein